MEHMIGAAAHASASKLDYQRIGRLNELLASHRLLAANQSINVIAGIFVHGRKDTLTAAFS